MTFTIVKKTSKTISISGVYYGTMAQYHSLLDSFIAGFPSGATAKVNQYNWIGAVQAMAGSQYLNTSTGSDYVRFSPPEPSRLQV